jgi:hypothetical protein
METVLGVLFAITLTGSIAALIRKQADDEESFRQETRARAAQRRGRTLRP